MEEQLGWKMFFVVFGLLQILAVILLKAILSRLDNVERRADQQNTSQRLVEYRLDVLEAKERARA